VDPILNCALWIVAVPAVAACSYLFTLTLLSARAPVPKRSSRTMRFDVIVPAHNEEFVLGNVIQNLQKLDWPADRYRILVVADNCTDSTAAIAAAAGAQVLERFDPQNRGKGYALEYAFKVSRAREWAQALIVIDADAHVSPNLLESCACRIEQGEHAVQVHYGVSNLNASWRTRLLSIAMAAFHGVRSRARERLGLSCGFRGNGWAVTHTLLDKVPYKAYSLAEDLEYGIDVGMAGFRVAYADEARADAEMVTGEKAARKQRQRWESGRFELIRSKTLLLLGKALRDRSAVCFDLACDLLVLPLSYVVMNVVLLLVLATAAVALHAATAAWIWCAIACAGAIGLYILRGWQLSGAGLRGLLDLSRAPFFLMWKVFTLIKGRGSKEWVRTKREGT
jgi:cellulose synthase/poly-beta-1,6-N-acetylglucosamine synthase-like glycosyltransferase